MPHSSLKLGRIVVLAGLIGLGLTACGRKGPLEPPPTASNAIDLPDRDTGADQQTSFGTESSPLARPSKANRAIAVPDKSFVLDPLL